MDFYHVTEYLATASHAVYPKKKDQIARKQWLSDACSKLKHKSQAANLIYTELMEIKASRLPKKIQEGLEATLTYFKNNKVDRMDYAYHTDKNLPIGSGVTEAACKGARIVLSLRALIQTTNRWQEFWKKINQAGVQFQLI